MRLKVYIQSEEDRERWKAFFRSLKDKHLELWRNYTSYPEIAFLAREEIRRRGL